MVSIYRRFEGSQHFNLQQQAVQEERLCFVEENRYSYTFQERKYILKYPLKISLILCLTYTVSGMVEKSFVFHHVKSDFNPFVCFQTPY